MDFHTADLCDQHGDQLAVVAPMFRHFGGARRFGGRIATLKCFEDNSLVRECFSEAGEGRVLVIDGGGSLRCALVGDQLAELAVKNAWAGVVVYGCIRDAEAMGGLPLGVMALAAHPLRSIKRGVGERGLALNFGGVVFRPGEYLYADEDGVVVGALALA
ncbi:3-hexulose-6-phosphate synthase [Burkholderiales bacterium]|nr:3-hexulose-6-phosphate synthase [Burkholderiales bacterium]